MSRGRVDRRPRGPSTASRTRCPAGRWGCRRPGSTSGGTVIARRGRQRRAALAARSATLFAEHHGRYGSPRITADLRDLGWRVSENTVAALMAEQHLVARPKRAPPVDDPAGQVGRGRPRTLLGRDFSPAGGRTSRWCGDLTEIPTGEGKFYLAAVLDLHSRRCVGFAMGAHHDADLARAALCVAIAVRGGTWPGWCSTPTRAASTPAGCSRRRVRRAGVTQSMGRTGSALDNAVAESFNSTLEFELLRGNDFATREQARRAVAGLDRRVQHGAAALDRRMLSPVDYERAAAARRQTAARHGRAHHRETTLRGDAPRRLRGRPSGLKGRSAIAARRPPAALDPGASAAPGRPAHGQARACPGARGAPITITRSHQSKSLRFQGIAPRLNPPHCLVWDSGEVPRRRTTRSKQTGTPPR